MQKLINKMLVKRKTIIYQVAIKAAAFVGTDIFKCLSKTFQKLMAKPVLLESTVLYNKLSKLIMLKTYL